MHTGKLVARFLPCACVEPIMAELGAGLLRREHSLEAVALGPDLQAVRLVESRAFQGSVFGMQRTPAK